MNLGIIIIILFLMAVLGIAAWEAWKSRKNDIWNAIRDAAFATPSPQAERTVVIGLSTGLCMLTTNKPPLMMEGEDYRELTEAEERELMKHFIHELRKP